MTTGNTDEHPGLGLPARRYTRIMKGKGRAQPAAPFVVMAKNSKHQRNKIQRNNDQRNKDQRKQNTQKHASLATRRARARDLRTLPAEAKPREAQPSTNGFPIERRQKAREGARKQWGEISESQFFAKAVTTGFGVAKPWGDSDSYDFILDAGGARLHRIQVKSSFIACEKGKYRATVTGSNRRRYTKEDADFLVAYIVPKNAWYILPIEAVEHVGGISLYPDSHGRSKYEKYREAWCQLACKHDRRKRRPLLRVCWRCGKAGECVVK